MLFLFLFIKAVCGFSPGLPAPMKHFASSARFDRTISSLGSTKTDDLLSKHASTISKLKSSFPQDFDDIQLLRFAVAFDDDFDAAASALKETDGWRKGEGKGIIEAATKAIEAARAGGGWDNAEIFSGAPHSAAISPFISPSGSEFITLVSRSGQSGVPYLVKVIRAGSIDDKNLMAAVSTEQMVEFFMYATVVNSLVADSLTREGSGLVTIVTANDLGNVDLLGDATFRKALSAASKKANALYPGLGGPTILLNLPAFLGALVKVFKPLFPPAVQKKLKFEQGPLKNVGDLRELGVVGDSRETFLKQIDAIIC